MSIYRHALGKTISMRRSPLSMTRPESDQRRLGRETRVDGVGQGTVQAVTDAVDGLRAELIRRVSEVVRIESVNPKYPGQVYEDVVGGEGRVSAYMADVYREIGCEVELVSVETGRDKSVGVLRGIGGGRSLIFNGHVDVVPPGDPANWKSGSPFSGRVDGDRIWGRGSTDMKGGVMAQ